MSAFGERGKAVATVGNALAFVPICKLALVPIYPTIRADVAAIY